MYTQLSRDERIVISFSRRLGKSYRWIAERLGRSVSTIWYEIKRNTINGRYDARTAHNRTQQRRKNGRHHTRLIENTPILARKLERLLTPLFSPETAAHVLGIHHQTIYDWINRSRPDLRHVLPYQGKKRRKYGTKRDKKQGWTRHVRSIDERPRTTELWEGDTVKGRTRARLLTHVEKHSLYLKADVIESGKAHIVHTKTKNHDFRGSITYDRGSEFTLWRLIERDTVPVYFAHAHHPWERGVNENTNGRLRRVFPKRYDFATLSQRELNRVVRYMNNTPRKSLAWRTPTEVLREMRSSSR